MSPRIHTYPGVAFAMTGEIAVLLWTGEPTLAANQWAVNKIISERRAVGADLVLLQIIAEGAGTPGPEARRYIQEVYKRELSDMRRVVTAPLGGSFHQSLIRTILRGMAILARKSDYVTVVSTLDDGFAAVTRGRTTPTVTELASTVEAMFAALRAPRGSFAPPSA